MAELDSESDALAFAKEDIAAHDNVGRIELVDRTKRIVYFDVYEELS